MNRRAMLAAFAASLLSQPSVIRADSGLPAHPNPSTSCANPFVRPRILPTADDLLADLLMWAHANGHIRTGYVLVAPDLAHLVPPSGTMTVARATFHIKTFDGVPPADFYGIAADCGTLL